jgi:hypothetical protein
MGFIILCTRWRSTAWAASTAVPLAVRTFVVVVLATRFSTSSYIRRGHVGGWVAKQFDRMTERCGRSSLQSTTWLPRSYGHFFLSILEI